MGIYPFLKERINGNEIATRDTLAELFTLAKDNPAYEDLLRRGSMNLGGPAFDAPLEQHKRWLHNTALETTEEGVVDEVNFVIE